MSKSENLINFPTATKPNFKIVDINRKRPTRRRAIACGTIYMSVEAFKALESGTLPKGNVLALAEAAGIMGSKKTADIIPLCHPLSLEEVDVTCSLDSEKNSVTVYTQAMTFAKTGVEMEALVAANTALLTIWDLTKGIDPSLQIGGVELLAKTGGKSGMWTNPRGIPDWLAEQLPSEETLQGATAGVLVMSDRASQGDYEDESGKLLLKLMEKAGAEISHYQVIPDDKSTITSSIKSHIENHKPDLLIASGGTGPGPRDVTPEVMEEVCDRMLDGLGELLRTESGYFTDTAWLSRMNAGMLGSTLIVTFPGSPKAVKECWDIISPFIGTALARIKKQGYEVK